MKDLDTNRNQYLIIGLGNPGRDYECTRHNIGFLVIDHIALRWNVRVSRYKHKALVGKKKTETYSVMLVKPQTYMNLSGVAVKALVDFSKPSLANILVIFDDLDLPFGEIRIRQSGGSSGHNGMRSIIEKLGTLEIPRLRVGVGRPRGKKDPADFILDQFANQEQKDLPLIIDFCAHAVETFIQSGIAQAMTEFNHSVLKDD